MQKKPRVILITSTSSRISYSRRGIFVLYELESTSIRMVSSYHERLTVRGETNNNFYGKIGGSRGAKRPDMRKSTQTAYSEYLLNKNS